MEVSIQVRQVNFAPVFYSSHYFATITEDLEVGDVVIANIEAVDFDLVMKDTLPSEALPCEGHRFWYIYSIGLSLAGNKWTY